AVQSLLVVTLLAAATIAGSPPPTGQPPLTIILVRHAEKKDVPPENKDPDLSPAGMARAEELVRMFGDSGVGAIYATQYKRTQQTIKPLADKLNLPVTQIDAKK